LSNRRIERKLKIKNIKYVHRRRGGGMVSDLLQTFRKAGPLNKFDELPWCPVTELTRLLLLLIWQNNSDYVLVAAIVHQMAT
jgi:hypothetical protein